MAMVYSKPLAYRCLCKVFRRFFFLTLRAILRSNGASHLSGHLIEKIYKRLVVTTQHGILGLTIVAKDNFTCLCVYKVTRAIPICG
jgi:hypothetical protein